MSPETARECLAVMAECAEEAINENDECRLELVKACGGDYVISMAWCRLMGRLSGVANEWGHERDHLLPSRIQEAFAKAHEELPAEVTQ